MPNGMDEKLRETVLEPFVKGLQEDGLDFRGVIFIGLMIENNEAKVLEFNVRFGDPETQSILLRLDSDLYEIMNAVALSKLDEVEVKWKDEQVTCVVLSSGGYPGSYEKSLPITGLDQLPDDIIVFHAGTAMKDGRVVRLVEDMHRLYQWKISTFISLVIFMLLQLLIILLPQC